MRLGSYLFEFRGDAKLSETKLWYIYEAMEKGWWYSDVDFVLSSISKKGRCHNGGVSSGPH